MGTDASNPLQLTEEIMKQHLDCVDTNSTHIVKCIEYARAKLIKYYNEGARMGDARMSIAAYQKIDRSLEDALKTFNDVDGRVKKNITDALNKEYAKARVPRRTRISKMETSMPRRAEKEGTVV